MSTDYKIKPTAAATAAAIKRKSAFSLPDRPSERGMKPAEIKRALYGPITDDENSVMAELKRIISEANAALGDHYTKEEIDVMMETYISEMADLIGNVDALVGGGSDEDMLTIYSGEYSVTPSSTEQVLDTASMIMASDLTIEEIPYAEVSNNSSGITATIG